MRILNLHFKNINSLEGENRINFEQAPFSDTGVFAITGPNGSGKSSILDAITLGLYGETFRFDRPARFVMTKHTRECFSEIEFALGNERYKSSWRFQQQEGDNDDLAAAQMQLIRLNDGEILADTAQQVCARITEITGMNFRNFTRSILLAQGDFAAFLNALDSERLDILEKIISTDIYADYKKEVTDKADAAQQIIDRLKQELAAIPLLESGQYTAYEHDLHDFQEQYAELQEQQGSLQQQQTVLNKITDLQNQISYQKKRLKDDRAQLENIQQTLDQIEVGQNALLFKDDITAIAEKNQAVKQSKSELAAFHDELQQIKNKLANNPAAAEVVTDKTFADQLQVIANVKAQVNLYGSNRQSETALWQSLGIQINTKKATLETVESWLEANAADEILLENFPETARLKKLKAELVQLSARQKLLTKQAKKSDALLKKNSTALNNEQSQSGELKLQLEKTEKELEALAQGNSLEDIQALSQDQRERVKAFHELNNLAEAHQKLTGGSVFFGLFSNNKAVEFDVDAFTAELEKTRQEIKREENIKLALDEAILREGLLKKMLADRHHLVDGKPCPLCGSLQHPYTKRAPAVANSLQALVDQQLKIKALAARADNLAHRLLAGKKHNEKNRAIQAKVQQIRSQWSSLCNRLNTASQELDIDNIRLMKRLLQSETNELKTIVSLATKYRSKNDAVEKLKVSITRNINAVEQLNNSVHKLNADWQLRLQEKFDVDAALAKSQQEEKELSLKVLEQLSLLGEKMPGKGQEDALFDRLNARRQDYQTYLLRRKSLTEELEALKAKQAICQTEISEFNQQLDVYTRQLHAEEAIGLHLALIEKQKLIVNKEQLLMQQEADAAALHQALLDKLKGTQFTYLNELTDMLELIENQPELERQKAEREQQALLKTTELEKSSAQLEIDFALAESALSPEDADIKLKEIAVKMDIAKMEVRHLEKLLQEQNQLQQKHAAILLQLQQQEAAAQPRFAEAALIAAENGMEFRRRVQTRVADQLLSQTNAILEKISGRYYLRQIPSDQGLALAVEDTFQGNAQRLPKTLSGGESFVVSLALALGLSELANNGKSVDSLFLDEGFGNLDAESLYTVISTLEGLQTHGKTVGVISHVETVQKRFKAQLQIVKKPNGLGQLRKAS